MHASVSRVARHYVFAMRTLCTLRALCISPCSTLCIRCANIMLPFGHYVSPMVTLCIACGNVMHLATLDVADHLRWKRGEVIGNSEDVPREKTRVTHHQAQRACKSSEHSAVYYSISSTVITYLYGYVVLFIIILFFEITLFFSKQI